MPPERVAPSVQITGLVKSFGSSRAIDGIDLAVAPGTFLVLLGPSGSGKSTLVRCLAGIEVPTGGLIRLGERVVDGPGRHLPPERRDLAMVFQDYALWPHLSAEQNVAFALRRRRLSAPERRQCSRAILDAVGLAGLHDRFPGQLSGGEQQRVALARALVAEPGLLLFDEPLSNLDADRREQLRVDIGHMVRLSGATAVYITHDQAEAFALADKVGVLDHGRLLQLDDPEIVYRNPATAFVARFTGLSGELPGTVVSADATSVVVALAGGTLAGRPLASFPLSYGQPVRVLVRPSASRVAGPGRRGVTPAPRGPVLDGPVLDGPVLDGPVLDGVVCDVAFRGWGYDHVVEVPGGHRLSGVSSPHRLAFGERVGLHLDEAGCLVVADDVAPCGPLRVGADPPQVCRGAPAAVGSPRDER